MRLPEIKRLVDNHSKEDLLAAATALENGDTPSIEVNGEDEGEQLTHLLAAAEVLEKAEASGDLRGEFRAFAARVRDVIKD